MSLFAISQRTTQTVAANATWEVIAASANKPQIMEVGFSQVTAVAGTMGLGRPTATGISPSSPLTVVDEGDGNAPTGLTTCAIAWGTAPTVPANFNRRITSVAGIGAGVIWTFPRGLWLPVTKSIVLWVIATAPVLDAWAVVME